MIEQIVCDVHGILLDVVTPFCEKVGFDKQSWPRGEYSFEKATGHSFSVVAHDLAFWEGLKLTLHGTYFVHRLDEFAAKKGIKLTFCSVAGTPEIAAGTHKAFHAHVHGGPLMVVNQYKFRYFVPQDHTTVLIDDYDKELEMWHGYKHRVTALWNDGKDYNIRGTLNAMLMQIQSINAGMYI